MTGPLATLVADALACLAREHPEAHAAMCARLGARALSITLGTEQFAITAGTVTGDTPMAALAIGTDAATLDDVLGGELAVLDALCSERLRVRGAVDDLIPAFAAATTFLQGAVRCVSMPPLLERLSRHAKEERT